jgi:nicotinate-nucleotide pyrophosphorylase (carboxylating)
VGGFALRIEVECQKEAEADEAIQAGADIVMLDNLKGEELKETARALKERWAGQKAFLIESSGGVTEYNVDNFFSPHIDIISMGSLSQGVPHVDFSLKIQKRE